MAATAGQMNIDRTAAASLAAAMATGFMIMQEATTTGLMEISEPTDVSGLMQLQTHASNGLMLIIINS